jgi:hypothetical protein
MLGTKLVLEKETEFFASMLFSRLTLATFKEFFFLPFLCVVPTHNDNAHNQSELWTKISLQLVSNLVAAYTELCHTHSWILYNFYIASVR